MSSSLTGNPARESGKDVMKKKINTQSVKMLQAILNGQQGIKEELKSDIKKVRDDLSRVEKNLSQKIEENSERLDKIGNEFRQFKHQFAS